MTHTQLASKSDKYLVHDVARASVREAMTGPRMTASSRRTARTSASVNCRFRPEQWVYNRSTKEHGLIRHVYRKDGVTMYKAWLPARPDLLHWGHYVSDWAECVLERADNVAP
jgi:hypothetical protein